MKLTDVGLLFLCYVVATSVLFLLLLLDVLDVLDGLRHLGILIVEQCVSGTVALSVHTL